jgi:hypothetical protein
MLAVLAFCAFAIAGILRLVHAHGNLVTWLIIAGGLLVSAAVAWGWAGPRYYNRTPPA